MKAFLTGGTGFVGTALIKELLAHGAEVTATVRTFERAQQLPRGVRAVPADITKPNALPNAMRGHDVVFHLAAVTRTGVPLKDRERVQRINVEGTRHVLNAAAEAGVPRIIHVSCASVAAEDLVLETETQRAKQRAHFEVAVEMQKRGLPLTIACLGTVYGPGDASGLARLMKWQARGRLLVMLAPESVRAFTFVEDAARGLRLCAERGRAGETYNLVGPRHTFKEFFAACAEATGQPAPYVWLPPAVARGAARLLQRPLPAWTERLRSLTTSTPEVSSEQAQAELGWKARGLRDGLSETFKL
jgi:dihydroflavonol-4-reductase